MQVFSLYFIFKILVFFIQTFKPWDKFYYVKDCNPSQWHCKVCQSQCLLNVHMVFRCQLMSSSGLSFPSSISFRNGYLEFQRRESSCWKNIPWETKKQRKGWPSTSERMSCVTWCTSRSLKAGSTRTPRGVRNANASFRWLSRTIVLHY